MGAAGGRAQLFFTRDITISAAQLPRDFLLIYNFVGGGRQAHRAVHGPLWPCYANVVRGARALRFARARVCASGGFFFSVGESVVIEIGGGARVIMSLRVSYLGLMCLRSKIT